MTPQIAIAYKIPEGYKIYRRNGDYALFKGRKMVKKWKDENPTELEVRHAIENEETDWDLSFSMNK